MNEEYFLKDSTPMFKKLVLHQKLIIIQLAQSQISQTCQ